MGHNKEKFEKYRTISLSQVVDAYLNGVQITEDAEFEIIDNRNCVFNINAIDNRLKELCALEDISHETVSSK